MHNEAVRACCSSFGEKILQVKILENSRFLGGLNINDIKKASELEIGK